MSRGAKPGQFRGVSAAREKLKKTMEKFSSKEQVMVGVPAGSGSGEDGTSIVEYATYNEFGATVKHPGGTSYGYKTEKDAIAGKVRFLKSGQGYMQLGVTGPHTFDIPERSFLRVPLRQNSDKIKDDFKRLLKMVVEDKLTLNQALNQIGAKAASISQEAISAGIAPENAPSTIAKKGQGKNTLVDTGRMRQAITWVVRDKE